jgi:hypothetical protein
VGLQRPTFSKKILILCRCFLNFFCSNWKGGPMAIRGLELIMWSQGQWEALKKTAS